MSKHAYPYLSRLRLENFTAFRSADFEFVPGVNAFIGENGTGKTHVLEIQYSAYSFAKWRNEIPSPNLKGLFQIDELKESIRVNRDSSKHAIFGGQFGSYP